MIITTAMKNNSSARQRRSGFNDRSMPKHIITKTQMIQCGN